jgi:hypothetical protein
MLFTFLDKKALATAGVGAMGVGATMAQDWRPGESYLAKAQRRLWGQILK